MLRADNIIEFGTAGRGWHALRQNYRPAPAHLKDPTVTTSAVPVPIIDIVSGIWTEEALSFRPGWQEQFFAGKMKSKTNMKGVSLEDHLALMAEAGIERAFLIAAEGRAAKACPAATTCPTRWLPRPSRSTRTASRRWPASIRMKA